MPENLVKLNAAFQPMRKVIYGDSPADITAKIGNFPRHQADDAFLGQLSGGSRLITGGLGTSTKVKVDIFEYQQGVKEE